MSMSGELEKVMEKLQKKEAECKQLVEVQNKTMHEVEEKQKKQTSLEETIKHLRSQMKQLNHEVDTKSDMVCMFCFYLQV